MKNGGLSIYKIAKMAGVSPATVSRVLTGNANVSSEKKTIVENIIKKYDFKPNALARGLSSKRTKMIGLVVNDINNAYYANIVVECEKAAEELGYMLLVCNSSEVVFRQIEKLNRLFEQKVDAIIQIGGQVDFLQSDVNYVHVVNRIANEIPVLIVGKLDGADVLQYNIDHGKALEVALEYLIGLGHEDIVLLGGYDGSISTFEKRVRYIQIMRKHGMHIDQNSIIDCDYDSISGGNAILGFYQKYNRMPTGIIGINDIVAIGALRALNSINMSVPGHVSVVSIDNTNLTDICEPSLTSVGFDYKELANEIMRLSVQRINNEDVEYIKVCIPKLTIRMSSGINRN